MFFMFLVGVAGVVLDWYRKSKARIGCQFIAALIRYFLLATFFWMNVEGWVLYQNFVKVFGGQKEQRKFIIQSSLFAWGKFLSPKFLLVFIWNVLETNKVAVL